MTTRYRKYAKSTKSTSQSLPIVGRESEMVQNSAGGYTFSLSAMKQLERFLILGSESNTYYASGNKLTEDNAKNIIALIQSPEGISAVEKIVEISDSGRAPQNEPALFALALAMTYGDENVKRLAFESLPKVARIGTHVLHLAEYVKSMRSWGRGVRNAFAQWYLSQAPKSLAVNLTKYAQRDGWTHRDVLRLAHPQTTDAVYNALFAYVTNKSYDFNGTAVEDYMNAVIEVKNNSDVKRVIELISAHKLPREVLPTELLQKGEVWEALVPHMKIGALIRNVGNLSKHDLLTPMSAMEQMVLQKLGDRDVIKAGRVHPIQFLSALNTYNSGHGVRGSSSWNVNARISAALENGFYLSFDSVVPTGKRFYLGIDVSSSMTWGEIAKVPGLSPHVAATCMAMVTARSEKLYHIAGFCETMRNLNISANDTLSSASQKTQQSGFGGTDCAAPIMDALKKGMEVDTFVTYTDNETWAGSIHPTQALLRYRIETGINAKLVVVGMIATDFTIADPSDNGQMDVVGFDASAPSVIAEFSRGTI